MKVSVIIPVYNTGEYLWGCIKSICRQTHSDLQIIMVDDGSEPFTAAICDKIAGSDPRIELIRKQNEGVSIARNTALEIAMGEIVCFVDSDDTIHPRMISRLVAAISDEDVDIAMCDAVTIRPGKPDELDTISGLPTSCILDKQNINPTMLTRLAGSACRCAYRRTDMLVPRAKFPVGVKFSEDRIFNIIAMGQTNRIAYIKEPYYNRLIRKGSACFRFYPDMTSQIEKMRSVLLSAVQKYWGCDYIAEYERQIAGQILYAVTHYTSPANGLSRRKRKEALQRLCTSESVRACLTRSGVNNLRSFLIKHKCHRALAAIGRLTNTYHRLCCIGQYQH